MLPIPAIDLRNIPCFAKTEKTIPDLAVNTLVYGVNGSGKSSIASAIAHRFSDSPDEPFELMHFDKHYVERLINEDSVPGIFTLTDASPDVQDRINKLDGDEGLIATASRNVDTIQGVVDGATAQLGDALASLADEAWKGRDELPEKVRKLAAGSKNAKATFAIDLLAAAATRTAPPSKVPTLTELTTRADVLTGDPPQPIEALPTPFTIRPISEAQTSALAMAITPNTDSPLMTAITQLGIADWVHKGVPHIKEASPLCPFCQQELESGRAGEISALFDDVYQTAIAGVSSTARVARESLQSVTDYRSAFPFEALPEGTAVKDALDALAKTLMTNAARIAGKLEAPSSQVQLESTTAEEFHVKTAVEAFENARVAHNKLVTDRPSALQTIADDIWDYLIFDKLRGNIAGYHGKCSKPNDTIKKQTPKLDAAKKKLQGFRDELSEKAKAVNSTVETVERINRTLTGGGFMSFTIVRNMEGAYQLVRPDGTSASETLSEGERNLVAFLYFFHSLRANATDPDRTKDLIALIDDPISSLDTETLFLVSLLHREILTLSLVDTNHLAQVILLTHNAFFFKEAAYTYGKGTPPSRLYVTLRKNRDGQTVFQTHQTNPISSSYELLWGEVVEAEADPTTASVALPNTMRRILENYFTFTNGVPMDFDAKSIDDDIILEWRALRSWTMDGSHNAAFDPDFSPTPFDGEKYLRAFAAIFKASGQENHYTMMMGAARAQHAKRRKHEAPKERGKGAKKPRRN